MNEAHGNTKPLHPIVLIFPRVETKCIKLYQENKPPTLFPLAGDFWAAFSRTILPYSGWSVVRCKI